jgi:hypothetical protein
VEAIGPAVERPNGEFAGMALLDVEQFARLMAEAEPQQSLPHALAALSLVALEVTSGWLELRSFAHYQDACRQVAR